MSALGIAFTLAVAAAVAAPAPSTPAATPAAEANGFAIIWGGGARKGKPR